MWIGIPYTNYGYSVKLPRTLIFCVLAGLLYLIITLPETKEFVGSYTGLERHDDTESNDKYYLLIIHTLVFTFLIYVLIRFYNPNSMAVQPMAVQPINQIPILQKKV